MKKKLVSILLCVAMVATLFAGCGTGNGDTQGSQAGDGESDDPLRAYEGTTLTVAHNQGEYIWDSFYAIGDAFEEKTGIKIEWQEIASSDYDTWCTAQFSGGQEPDILWTLAGAKDYFDQGKLADLTPYYDKANAFNGITWKDCFSETGLENVYSSDGSKMIATAMTYATVNLYYNKDIMTELGLGTEPPTTFTEMVEMMDVAKKDGKYIPMSVMNSMGWNLTWIEPDFMDAMFSDTDVVEKLDIIVPNGYLDDSEILLGLKSGVLSYDDPRFEEYFTLMKELTQYYNEDFNTISWEFEGLFNDNQVLFTFNGGWYPGQVVQNGYDVNYGAAPKPYVDTEYAEYGVTAPVAYAQDSGEAALFVTKKCEDNDKLGAAVLFLQFMTDYQSGAQMYIDAVMLETCILNVKYPEEMASLANKEYGDVRQSNIIKAFKFTGEVGNIYWTMYSEYLDAASTQSAAEFIEDLKAELLPYLDDAIEDYTAFDVLSYLDQVK